MILSVTSCSAFFFASYVISRILLHAPLRSPWYIEIFVNSSGIRCWIRLCSWMQISGSLQECNTRVVWWCFCIFALGWYLFFTFFVSSFQTVGKRFILGFTSMFQIKYVSGSYDTEEGFQLLDGDITKYECEQNSQGVSRRLFYLALPPSVYPSVCRMISLCCMDKCMFIELCSWRGIKMRLFCYITAALSRIWAY